MPAVVLAAPGPVFLDSEQQGVQANATLTTSGSTIYNLGFGAKQLTLIVNVKAAPTGTTPALTYTLQEVDPGDGVTALGATATTGAITAIGIKAISLPVVMGGAIKVTWTITGTTPSFTQVYATVSAKVGGPLVGQDTNGVDRLISVDLIGRLNQNMDAWFGATTPSVGQKAMAASIPVTFASDQTAIVVVPGAPAGSTASINFGETTQSTINTFAVRKTTYTEQAANFTGSMSSSNAADAAAGTGARTIRVTYLDTTGAGPFTEDLTLNGTTPVNLVNANHRFIEKIEVLTVGTGVKNAGTISLFAGLAGAGALVGTVTIGDNRTQWAHHYVPTGKVCNITGTMIGSSSTLVGGGSTFKILVARIGVANQVECQVTDTHTLFGLSSQVQRGYTTAIPVATGPARLTMYVTTTTSTSLTYRGSFDFYDQ